MIKTIRHITCGAMLLAIAGSALTANGAPVSPEDARAEAAAFRGTNASYFKKAPGKGTLTLAYTATAEGKNCFYVFNDGMSGGYTIVSADDRLPAVIGFSENGAFEYEKIPDNMKWWLSQYINEINAFLKSPSAPNVKSIKRAKAEERDEISPLLTSKWNQTEPYNNLCPIDPRTGQRSVTGCVATAMAQVMRHYEWPLEPTGSANGYVFKGNPLDWANMIDDYVPGKYSATQATAVATLMLQCGKSVNMQYSSYMSGAYSNDVQVALREYFDYDPSLRMEWRDYHTIREWNDMVYNELANNRPVYYSGRSAQGGHAFVCDGYLANNFFHFNWGWGGYQDGYFLLNSLNPDTGGTGSYSGGYNADQSIITGVIKNRHSGDDELQVTMLATGNFLWKGGTTYRIEGSPDTDLMYNPLAYQIKVTMGLKFTSVSNPENVTYSKSSGIQSFGPYYGTPELSAPTPNLASGKYYVSPAIFTEYGKWEDVQTPYGYQRFVTLTVENGKYTFKNEGPEEEGTYKLLCGQPQAVGKLYCNAPKSYRVTVSNVGDGDFFGQLGLTLWYMDDMSGDGDEQIRQVAVPAGSSMDIEFFLPNCEMKPGTYALSIIDTNGEMLHEPIEVVYEEGTFPKYKESGLVFSNISPNFPTTGGELGISMEVDNNTTDDIAVQFEIVLLDLSDMAEVTKVATTEPYNFAALSTNNLNFQPRELPIVPGDYFWIARDMQGNWLSLPMPVKAFGPVTVDNGISYQATDNKKRQAMVVSPLRTDYSGKITIPETIGGYTVTELKSDAFTFCDELTSLSIPSGINRIQTGQFYSAKALDALTVKAQNPPLLEEEAFAEGRIAATVLSTAYGRANIYKRTEGWKEFKMSSWHITIGNGITVSSGLETDPSTGTYYTPYYVNSFEPFVFNVTKPYENVVNANWTIGNENGNQNFWERVQLPALTGTTGKVNLKLDKNIGVDTVEEDMENADIYTATGILLKANASPEEIKALPEGLYIIGNRKVMVK